MQWLQMILEHYHQHKVVFAIVVLILFILLIFRFRSLVFRLFLIAVLLFGAYYFIAHFAGLASKHKRALIDQYFSTERLQ